MKKKRPQNRRRNGVVRDAKGRVVAGALNPGGRPKSNVELRARCRDLSESLIERLHRLALRADSDAASVAAIKLLLAYGYGTPESHQHALGRTHLEAQIDAILDRLKTAFANEPCSYTRALEAIAAEAVAVGAEHRPGAAAGARDPDADESQEH